MSDTKRPHDRSDDRSEPVSVERLRELLDAYGATPDHWPEAERDAAERLVARSADAATLAQEASALDRLLDAAAVEAPSAGLAARVLAAAPRRRTRRARRVLVAAVPLAAAAAVVLWLTTAHDPARRVADAPMTIGEYASPTDVLLEPWGGDTYATLPSVGCSDSVLGCPTLESIGPLHPQQSSLGRLRA